MRIQIRHRYNSSVLFECDADSVKIAVKLAIEAKANLYMANLSGADLSRADLSVANLSRADLSVANLSVANLSGANLSGANLSGADLSRANLSGADLDFASWPLWCGTKKVKVCAKIFAQLCAHLSVVDYKIPDALKRELLKVAIKSHRAVDLGIVKAKGGA